MWKGIYKKTAHPTPTPNPTPTPTGASAYLLHELGLVFTYSEIWTISEHEVIEPVVSQAPFDVQSLEIMGQSQMYSE